VSNVVRLGWLTAIYLIGAQPVDAQLIDATDPERVVSVIQALGYRAALSTDAAGDPLIESSAGGAEFSIYFYGCDAGASCRFLLFKVGYDTPEPVSANLVNEWNAQALFGRAFVDAEGRPWLEMPVNLYGGVSSEGFADTFDWWELILGQFEEAIGFSD
jgi:Putative bacterial sensory transduction regulator